MKTPLYTPLIFAFALALNPFSSIAQEKCLHDQLEAEVARIYPDYLEQQQEFINSVDFDVEHATEGTVYTIPVVVHVIWDAASDNISEAQIKDAIAVINEDYRRMNWDTVNTRAIFAGVAADCEIQFQLAKLDPQGNCTNGITRTKSALTVDARNNVKALKSWPNNKYLNIWVVRTIDDLSGTGGTILGYAYKPSPGQNTTYDGIVIRHDQMGRIGTSNSEGRTLTHESGHYLGLDHPFKNGCFGGDNCADTPPVQEASYGCNHTANSCSNDVPNLLDQVENYMDYADDGCANMFTDDQKAIMRTSLQTANRRGYLVTNSNAQATGISPNQALPCAPVALFSASSNIICEGETIDFTDMSAFGNPTSWTWQFPGGNPSTSTSQNPSVTYNSPGVYPVSLNAVNAVGNDVNYQAGFVSVRGNSGMIWVNGFNSGFEFNNVPNGAWHVDNPDGDTIKWRRINNAKYEGSYAVKLNNYYNTTGYTDALVTDKIVVDRATAMTWSFRYAVAGKPGAAGDRLVVSVSDDCGETWTSARTYLGPLLYSALNQANPWTPTASNQWRAASVNLNAWAGGDPIMVKMELQNYGGNNAYLDDFSLAVTLSGGEETLMDLDLYPNPNTGSFTLTAPVGTDYTIHSVVGALVKSGTTSSVEESIEMNVPAGVYILRTATQSLRFVVQ